MTVRGFRQAIAAIVVIGLCAAVAGCSGLETGSAPDSGSAQLAAVEPRTGGRIVFGLEADPNGLDPTRNAWDNAGIQLANALYDPLTAFDADGRPQPYLAESLTPSTDFRTWTIKLRPGVLFHDGLPLTATEAVAYIEAIRLSAVTGPPARNIAELAVVDPLTLRVTMHEPWASFPALLAGQGGYVVSPKQVVSDKGHSEPNGTGPFKLRSWKTDERFDLVRNPSYWRAGLPRLDGVEFVVIDQGRDRLEMIRQGTMDATAVTRRNDVKALEEMLVRPNPRLIADLDTSDAEKDTLTINTTKPPFKDVRVRKALAYATDARALAVAHGWPLDRVAPGMLSPASPFHAPTSYPVPDVERARALVREYLTDPREKDKPKEIAFDLTGSDLNASWLQDLVAQWARAGIKARINLVPAKQLVRHAVVGNFDVAIVRYFAGQDPDVLWHFFVSDTVVDQGISLNLAHFRNDAITAGFNAGRATPDPERRRQAYAQVEKALAEQVPYFWLNRLEWRMVAAPKVREARNVTLPDGRPALPYVAGTYRLTETWLDG